jgi:hypothetical protein
MCWHGVTRGRTAQDRFAENRRLSRHSMGDKATSDRTAQDRVTGLDRSGYEAGGRGRESGPQSLTAGSSLWRRTIVNNLVRNGFEFAHHALKRLWELYFELRAFYFLVFSFYNLRYLIVCASKL